MRRKKGRCSFVLATWWRKTWDVFYNFLYVNRFSLIWFFFVYWSNEMRCKWLSDDFVLILNGNYLHVKLQLSFRIYTAIDKSLVYYLTTLVVQVIVSRIAVCKEHTHIQNPWIFYQFKNSHKNFHNSVCSTHRHISSSRFLFLLDFPPVAIPPLFATAFHFP